MLPGLNDKQIMLIGEKIIKKRLDEQFGKGKFLYLEAKPKLKGFSASDFYILFDNKKIDAATAVKISNEELKYFILYVTDDLLVKKQEIINMCL